MDKKTSIAVVVGILLVFIFVAGQNFLSGMMGSSSSTSDQSAQAADQITTDQAAAITNQDNNTQDAMQLNQAENSDQLQVEDETVGTGTVAVAGDQVTVNYTGTLTDGTKFDSSLDPGRTPFTFTLGAGQVIQGWDQGVAGMKVGGTRILVIPPSLGYGAQAVGPIPANSTLVFQVQLLSVSSSTSAN